MPTTFGGLTPSMACFVHITDDGQSLGWRIIREHDFVEIAHSAMTFTTRWEALVDSTLVAASMLLELDALPQGATIKEERREDQSAFKTTARIKTYRALVPPLLREPHGVCLTDAGRSRHTATERR